MTLLQSLQAFQKSDPPPENVAQVLLKEDPEDIPKFVVDCVKSSKNAYFILKVVLAGCLGSERLRGVRQKVLRKVLELFFEPDDKVKIEDNILTEVLLHLEEEPGLSPTEIARLTTFCMEETKSDREKLNPRWLPVLAKLLSLAGEQETMFDLAKDEDVKPSEYRLSQFRSFCGGKWNPQNIAATISMFREVSHLMI